MNKHNKILFTPETILTISDTNEPVAIKGQRPRFAYTINLLDIYPNTPSFPPYISYKKILIEITKSWTTASIKLNSKAIQFPEAKTDADARSILMALFDPQMELSSLSPLTAENAPMYSSPILVDNPSPFPLKLASQIKLAHTLQWIDANIKIQIEQLTANSGISENDRVQLVESALIIYCLYVKQDDFLLARSMNFNFSMFLQDRIVSLLFLDFFEKTFITLSQQALLSNKIAIYLLNGLGKLSYENLCSLSVFMGVIWTSSKEVQESFKMDPEKELASIESRLNGFKSLWAIDHRPDFLKAVADQSNPFDVVVMLDDNGESVFDMALFQNLLEDNSNLSVSFIVNRYGISNNISLPAFNEILNATCFDKLRNNVLKSRVNILVESQSFRSFEIAYLSSETKKAISNCRFCYIKGANFFETLQLRDVQRFYCFTVYGMTCKMLTGCEEGSGVFSRIDAGENGFIYSSPENIKTLREIINNRKISHAE